mmetsp:Transcript_1036/g.2081  ORF Transcript_1036/g.2081 Transcript_1036/m.2081 type:complete len:222 (-) Transcript_1036:647-1312(-)
MMISLSQSRIITQPLSKAVRSRHTVAAATAATRSKKSRATPLAAPLTLTQQSFQNHATSRAFLVLAASSAATLAAYQAAGDHGDDGNLFWKIARCSARNLGAEPVMLSPKTEPATGILFPRLCNGMSLAGCGVRIKWRFVKVGVSFRFVSCGVVFVPVHLFTFRFSFCFCALFCQQLRYSCDALLTLFPLLATIHEIIRCMQSEHIWTLSPCRWSKMTKKS